MKRFLIGVVVPLLLCACSGDAADHAAAAGKSDGPASAGLLADYKRRVIALMAGEFGGTCVGPDGAPVRGGITIDGAGMARASGWQADLMGRTETFVFGRVPARDGPSTTLFVSGPGQGWSLLLDGGGLTPSSARQLMRCTDPARARAIGANSVYGALASFFVRPAFRLNCIQGKRVRASLVAIAADGIKVDNRVYPTARGVREEHAYVDSKEAKLMYEMRYANGEYLILGVDASGDIAHVMAGNRDDTQVCVPNE